MKKTHRVERLVMGGAEDQEKHPDVWEPTEIDGSEEFCTGWVACYNRSGGFTDNMRIVKIPPPKSPLNITAADMAFVHTVLGDCLTLLMNEGNRRGDLQDDIREAMGRIGEAP